jgi:NUMOD3 motif
MADVVIYGLVDPFDGQIRYVGKATNPHKRYRCHLNDQTQVRRGRWIRSLLAREASPKLAILSVCDASNWQQAEQYWIAEIRARGHDLTNHTDGGEGLINATNETRAKLRAAREADWSDPKIREERLRTLRSPERRAKISAALTGLKKTPEHIAKLPQNRVGTVLTPAGREKLRQSLVGNKRRQGQPVSLETRKKISNALTGRPGHHTPQTPESNLKRSNAQTGQPKTEQHKERIRQGLLKAWARRKTI